MEILLQARADVDIINSGSESPICIASHFGLTEAVRLLGQYDCAIESHSNALTRDILRNAISRAENFDNQEAQLNLEAVLEIMANRRRRLQTLVSTTLSETTTSCLRLSKDRVLDEYLAPTFQLLKKHGIPIPASLDFQRTRQTVYHIARLTLSVAKQLWKAGFRDIDGFDFWGLSPLMRQFQSTYPPSDFLNTDLELISWFQSKGADFHLRPNLCVREVPFQKGRDWYLWSSTPLHLISSKIGHYISYQTLIFLGFVPSSRLDPAVYEWTRAKSLRIPTILRRLKMTSKTVLRGS